MQADNHGNFICHIIRNSAGLDKAVRRLSFAELYEAVCVKILVGWCAMIVRSLTDGSFPTGNSAEETGWLFCCAGDFFIDDHLTLTAHSRKSSLKSFGSSDNVFFFICGRNNVPQRTGDCTIHLHLTVW